MSHGDATVASHRMARLHYRDQPTSVPEPALTPMPPLLARPTKYTDDRRSIWSKGGDRGGVRATFRRATAFAFCTGLPAQSVVDRLSDGFAQSRPSSTA
jgi:hypothetical protein